MIEKTKVSVTISENFEDIMILMSANFSKTIKEDEHFFEDLGRKLDASFKDDDCNDNEQDKNPNILREKLKLANKENNKLKKENEDLKQYKKWQEEFINDMDKLLRDKRRVTTRRFKDE